MFRLFLINLLEVSQEMDKAVPDPSIKPPRRSRNRRIFDRFTVEHKHLALMNDQDILLVRDISSHGFSTEVSERGFSRLSLGDVYLCRLRYVGELYETKAKVAWKSKGFVGFELVDPSPKITGFFQRLLKPLAVGSGLQKMDEKYQNHTDNAGMVWYSGPNGSNFYLWQDNSGDIRSWRLEEENRYIKWDFDGGVKTGKKVPPKTKSLTQPWASDLKDDTFPDHQLRQFAIDVFMAFNMTSKNQLIETIVE